MIDFSKTTRMNLQDRNKPQLTYATAQSRSVVDIPKLAKHMVSHGNVLTAGAISACLIDMVQCIRELLLDSNVVQLGDLGTFYIKVKSRGVCESLPDEETGEKPVFTAADITKVYTKFAPGDGFAEMTDDATFNEVLTKEARAAALKEKKAQLAAGTYDPKGKGNNGGGVVDHI